MKKIDCHYVDHLSEVYARAADTGLLLTSRGKAGKDNVMTIGWCLIGMVWSKPVAVVLVRPSRYTHRLIEETGEYIINVPTQDMAETVNFCGSASGKQHDKFKERELIALEGRKVKVSAIQQCIIHYECRSVQKNEIIKENLTSGIIDEFYPEDDLHTVYFGEILACYARI